MGEFINFLGNNLADFWTYTGFANATVGHIVMILIGLFFIYLAVDLIFIFFHHFIFLLVTYFLWGVSRKV